jgi:hypothetical protein
MKMGKIQTFVVGCVFFLGVMARANSPETVFSSQSLVDRGLQLKVIEEVESKCQKVIQIGSLAEVHSELVNEITRYNQDGHELVDSTYEIQLKSKFMLDDENFYLVDIKVVANTTTNFDTANR